MIDMKKNVRMMSALGALALLGTLTAAPALAAPDRPLTPVSTEFKLAPGDDSSDPQPRWGDGSEWFDGPRIKCGAPATAGQTWTWDEASAWAQCVPRANAQMRDARAAYETARADWEARQSARSSAAQRPTYTPAPTTAAPAYTPPSYVPSPTAAPRSNTSDIPWPWIGGGALLALIGWAVWRRRSMRPAPAQGYGAARPTFRDRALGLLDTVRDRVDPGPRRGYSGDVEDYPPHRGYPSDADPFGGYEQTPAYADEQYAPTAPDPEPSARPPRNDGEYTHLDSLFNHDDGGK